MMQIEQIQQDISLLAINKMIQIESQHLQDNALLAINSALEGIKEMKPASTKMEQVIERNSVLQSLNNIANGYSKCHGTSMCWETEVNLAPPKSWEQEVPENDMYIMDYWNSLQYTLYETDHAETVDRTFSPRKQDNKHKVNVVFLSSPVECIGILLEGGKHVAGGFHLVLSPSWLSKTKNEGESTSKLWLHKSISFHENGTTYIDEYVPPRPVTYLVNYFTNNVTSGHRNEGTAIEEGLDCPMSSSVQLCERNDDKVLTRDIMESVGMAIPTTLALRKNPKRKLVHRGPDTCMEWIDFVTYGNGERSALEKEVINFCVKLNNRGIEKVVVKPSGPQFLGSVGVTIHDVCDEDGVFNAADALLTAINDGCSVLIEEFIPPLMPLKSDSESLPPLWRADEDLGFRCRATVCRDIDDTPVTTLINCNIGYKKEPINGDNTVCQSLESTLLAYNIRDKEVIQELEGKIRVQGSRVMRGIIESENLLSQEERGTLRGQTDVIGIDLIITDRAGVLTPVGIEVNGHDCTINTQIRDFMMNQFVKATGKSMQRLQNAGNLTDPTDDGFDYLPAFDPEIPTDTILDNDNDKTEESVLEIKTEESVLEIEPDQDKEEDTTLTVTNDTVIDNDVCNQIHFNNAINDAITLVEIDNSTNNCQDNMSVTSEGDVQQAYTETKLETIPTLLGDNSNIDNAIDTITANQKNLKLQRLNDTEQKLQDLRYYTGSILGRSIRPLVRNMVARSQRYMMEGKRIVIVGAGGVSKMKLWPDAKKYGIKVILIDSDPNHFAKYEVYKMIQYDFDDHTQDYAHACGIYKQLQQLEEPIDGCCTFWEDCVPLASLLCEMLGSKGVSYEAALTGKKKSRTQNALRARSGDIPHWPRSFLYASVSHHITSIEDIEAAVKRIHFPAFLKLEHGSSAVGGSVVYNGEELASAFVDVSSKLQEDGDFPGIGLGHDNSMVAMDFYGGSEHDIDVIIYDRKLVGAFISDNGPTNFPHFIETSATMPSTLPEDKQAQLITAAFQCCTEIGLSNGTFNVEMKMTSMGPKLIEINARMGGFYLRDWIMKMYGVDMMKAAMSVSAGIRPYVPNLQPCGQLMGIMLIPSQHDHVVRDDRYYQLMKKMEANGDIIYKNLSNSTKVLQDQYEEPFANIAVMGTSVADAKAKLKRVCKVLNISNAKYNVDEFLRHF